jgi:hypothetical protein
MYAILSKASLFYMQQQLDDAEASAISYLFFFLVEFSQNAVREKERREMSSSMQMNETKLPRYVQASA